MTEYVGKTWHEVHKRNTNARRWKTHTKPINQPLPQMTNGTTSLLAWLHQSTNTSLTTANTMMSGPSTTTTKDAP